MSLREVADKTGLSAAYLCDIEHGNRHAPVGTLEAIRQALRARIVKSEVECRACARTGHEPSLTLATPQSSGKEGA